MGASILYIFKADREIIPLRAPGCSAPIAAPSWSPMPQHALRVARRRPLPRRRCWGRTQRGWAPTQRDSERVPTATHLGTSPDAMTSLGTGSAHAPQFGTRPSAVATLTPPGVPVMPGSPLAPGTSFGSRYHIIRLLGMGGMGAVYQAWDDELGVAVALKVIRPEITADAASARDLERRFKRELLLARQVTHKNVVRIHDLGEIDGIKYITMPYIQGSDLGSVLSKQGKLPVSTSCRDSEAGREWPGGGARGRRRASGSEARQHHDRRGRSGGHHGLRDRALRVWRWRDGRGRRYRDARIHGPGAGHGATDRPARRRLCVRPDPVRHGARAAPGDACGERRRRADGARPEPAASCARHRSVDPRTARTHYRQVHAAGSGAAVSDQR